jgi:hypothetical protein
MVELLPARAAQLQPRRLDRAIATIAAGQHGVVARRQLLAIGATSHEVQERLDAGRLHRLHRGVYAVGHTVVSQRGRWMAAVLAAGPSAVLSHRTAAALWDLRQWTGVPHVTVAGARPQRRRLRLHFAALADDEVDTCDRIPVTSVARTILDLATTLPFKSVEHLYNEAQYQRLTSPVSLAVLLERSPTRPGSRHLRRLVERDTLYRTRVEMEADFLAFCDDRGLPRPDATNVSREIHGRKIEADAVYVEARLLVELDGGSHKTAARFHGDRARDRANLADGWPTIRVTAPHLRYADEADELEADLRALLRR